MDYNEFIEQKIKTSPLSGFEVERDEINPMVFEFQKDTIIWGLRGGKRALFSSFGLGKCHGIDTPILLHSGEIKKVQDVVVGDSLMGDDGNSRNVLSLARGVEQMYKITLKNGDFYTCNESHILSLKLSQKHNGNDIGTVVNMPLKEYLELPEYKKLNTFKHYKVPVDFKSKKIEFDPYIYGVWLGDGSKDKMSFTINDNDKYIIDKIYECAENGGLQVRKQQETGCSSYHLSHGKCNQKYSEKEFFKGSSNENGKFIYPDFLINSKKNRMQLLAGILDTDGYLIDKCYEIVTKWEQLRDDILYLCRSLGLSATHTIKAVNGVEYYRIFISGNTEMIPCMPRKKAGKRKQIKNPLVYGFTVESIGIGDYYGFNIDGNHLYLLGDFTVTHNTFCQLEMARLTIAKKGGKALIICPLGVKQEFTEDGKKLDIHITYVKSNEDILNSPTPIMITNYERVRDGGIDVNQFTFVTLDEASVLRSYGSKTYQEFLPMFENVPYRFVCTATPSPNKFKELIHYAGFLGIMDTGQALTRFFARNSQKANDLTLYPHKEEEFWLWMSSWALFVTKPSDLGYSDEGYDLPPLNIHYHCVTVDHSLAQDEMDGQKKLFRDSAMGLAEASREKRLTLDDRIIKMTDIVQSDDPEKHWIIWHDLEDERRAIKKNLPETTEVYGSQDIETKERNIIQFSNGEIKILATKPKISGSGCNFQRHCADMVFLGVGYKFNDFIQAIHRCYRFLQQHEVNVHVIYAESEESILKTLLGKWKQHVELVENMTRIIKQYGLTQNAMESLKRTIGIDRAGVEGQFYTAVNNDCVEETKNMEENSIDLIHTSIPFGNQYEYSPSYNDFGHNEDNEAFFTQMDFLVPNLLRILKPGRVAAIHVKDRILFGNATGLGMPSVDPFSDMTVAAFRKHGFIFFGRITVVTDVVRENNQTYRLGWTENSKDGSKMGCGMNEYILLFRKLPSDTSKAYADEPVIKSKEDYTRAHWQVDASGFWRSSGDRFLSSEEIKSLPIEKVQRYFTDFSKNSLYDYKEHIRVGQVMEDAGKLPATYMSIAPVSNDPDVWTDVLRMRTLNSSQTQKKLQNHVCPLQLDIVERVIGRFSNPGDLVLDPFGGLMTVPYMALKMNRKGYGIELNADYFRDGIFYLRKMECELTAPTLFDFEMEKEDVAV